MKLQQVQGRPFSYVCKRCQEVNTTRKPIACMDWRPIRRVPFAMPYADLDGKPFEAFYCEDCEAVLTGFASDRRGRG